MIIGISGKFGSGKATVSKMLATRLSMAGYNPYYRIYAGKLKEVVEVLTSVKMTEDFDNHFIGGIRDYTHEQKNIFIPEYDMTIGKMLQYIGTDMFRCRFDEYTWVKALFREWDNILSVDETSAMIIPDTRFPNEADVILSRRGSVLRLEPDPNMDTGATCGRDKDHPSETSLDDYDKFTRIIKNDSTLVELKNKIDIFVNEVLKLPT